MRLSAFAVIISLLQFSDTHSFLPKGESSMPRKHLPPLVIHAIVIFGILLVAFAPVISVAVAGGIANANGCDLDEGSVHPCIVNGRDIGSTLYTMGVLGWFMLATIPLGLALVVLYIAVVVGFTIARRVLRPEQK